MHLKAESKDVIPLAEAKARYTKAWNDYRIETNEAVKIRLEIIMDSLVEHIGKKHWDEFKDTLKGFNEFWEIQLKEIETRLGLNYDQDR